MTHSVIETRQEKERGGGYWTTFEKGRVEVVTHCQLWGKNYGLGFILLFPKSFQMSLNSIQKFTKW